MANDELLSAFANASSFAEKLRIRNDIVLGNMALVRYAASEYAPLCRHMEYDDLLMSGYIGLIKAIPKYDAQKGAFSTYALIYIKCSMLSALRDDSLIHVPAGVQSAISRYKAGEDVFLSDALICGMNAFKVTSLEAPAKIGTDGFKSLEQLFRSEDDPVYAEVSLKSAAGELAGAMSSLTEREQDIIRMHWLGDMRLADIAKAYGITPTRAGQIERKAFAKLRYRLCARNAPHGAGSTGCPM